jgi:hypothetical protein
LWDALVITAWRRIHQDIALDSVDDEID